jgi:uncharacterized protein (TIGR02145 family)
MALSFGILTIALISPNWLIWIGTTQQVCVAYRIKSFFMKLFLILATLVLANCNSSIDDIQGFLNPYSSSDGDIKAKISSSSGSNSDLGCSDYNSSTHFCDSRDGKVYKKVEIGSQIWMAENLCYDANGSKCYENDPVNCIKYGRLYDWAMAMDFLPGCNTSICSDQIESKHRGICPSGWHIPSDAEWKQLIHYADNTYDTNISTTAGIYLKATSGWEEEIVGGNGEDTYGFTAIPSGLGYSIGSQFNGRFRYMGLGGYWWSASEDDRYGAYASYIMDENYVVRLRDGKDVFLYSVRCIQN